MVSVLRNAGNGTYAAGSPIAVGRGPYGVTLGDVDENGDLDVLTPNYSDNTVSMRLNSGSSTFAAGQTIAVGSAPMQVVLGDMGGDLYLAVGNGIGAMANIVLNGGDATGSNTGVFANGAGVPVGTESGSVALADVDNDGDEDLLALSIAAGVVLVKLNGGNATGSNTGTFSGSGFVTVGSNSPVSLVLGDVDGDLDLDLDLLVANYGGSTVNVRLNNGTGSFSGSQSVGVGSSPHEVVLGDVDADGDLDLLTANAGFDAGGNTVSVRLNGGDATGSNTGLFTGGSTGAVGNNPRHLVLGDIDADGDLDVLTANTDDNTASVRLNGGTGPLAARQAALRAAPALFPNPTSQASTLTGAAPGAPIQVFDALGRLVAAVLADAAGTARLPAGLLPGVYGVRAAGQVPTRLLVE